MTQKGFLTNFTVYSFSQHSTGLMINLSDHVIHNNSSLNCGPKYVEDYNNFLLFTSLLLKFATLL